LLTSKGFATRSVCDVLDMLGETDEPLMFFCIHDADGYGTMIHEAMQEGAAARPARKVQIINLGLDPDEATSMGLEPEPMEEKKGKDGKKKVVAVARYVDARWRKWLQRWRIELNAMTTPQFLQWLDSKMAFHSKGKVVPPVEILSEKLEEDVENKLREKITAEVLAKAGLEVLLQEGLAELLPVLEDKANLLTDYVRQGLEADPANSWTEPVARLAQEMVEKK
jgi:hypothetical protein